MYTYSVSKKVPSGTVVLVHTGTYNKLYSVLYITVECTEYCLHIANRY